MLKSALVSSVASPYQKMSANATFSWWCFCWRIKNCMAKLAEVTEEALAILEMAARFIDLLLAI